MRVSRLWAALITRRRVCPGRVVWRGGPAADAEATRSNGPIATDCVGVA
jgi:hypothetical protein